MKRVLRAAGLAAAVLLAAVVVFVGWAYYAAYRGTHRHAGPFADVALPARADAARGKRLVTIRHSCVDCHAQDLGGAPVIDNPMVARIYAPNLTPAALSGWTDQEIVKAIRDGVSKDGRPLLLMPSQDYQGLSAKDLADMTAYLRSVKAVERAGHPSTLGPVMTVLYALGKVPTMTPVDVVAHEAPPAKGPPERADAKFGRYLARASCMGCHGADLKGGPIPGGDPSWPPAANITPDALATWSKADFFKTLRTGVDPSGAKLKAPMVVKYTAQYSDVELGALWAYIQSLPKTSL